MKALGKFLTPSRVLVVGFGVLIIWGTLLLTLPQATTDGSGLSFLDAVFTSTSAVCVTGLAVVHTGTGLTLFGQLVVLVLIQVGGIGFMTFATMLAIFMRKKITFRERLLLQEAFNQVAVEGIVRLARSVFFTSLIIELTGALILAIRWSFDFGWSKALYFGIFHSISAFNNAGFDVMEDYPSLTAYAGDPIINLTIMALIICGGLGFIVLADLKAKGRKKLRLHTKIVLTVSGGLIVLGAVLIFCIEYANPQTLGPLPLGTKIWASFFQSVTVRSAGFNTINFSNMYDTSLLFMIALMFIGASPGSTGGGIKTTTLVVIMLSVISTYRSQANVVLKGRTITKDNIQKAWAITTTAFLLIFLVVAILSLTERADLMTVIFEVTSAFGTTGLTLGLISTFSMVGKAAIIITMFIGRIGPLTLAFMLAQKNKSQGQIKYPEEQILIG